MGLTGLDYTSSAGSLVTVVLNGSGTGTATGASIGSDTITNFENIDSGSGFNDIR